MGARSKGAMMVGYVHDTTKLWRIYDSEHKTAIQCSDVIFEEERNFFISCPPSASIDSEDPLGLPKEPPEYEEHLVDDTQASNGCTGDTQALNGCNTQILDDCRNPVRDGAG